MMYKNRHFYKHPMASVIVISLLPKLDFWHGLLSAEGNSAIIKVSLHFIPQNSQN